MKIKNILFVGLMVVMTAACGSVEDSEDALLEIDCGQKKRECEEISVKWTFL